MNKHLLVILFSTIFLSSCVERYFIEDQGESCSLLVIDGTITNDVQMQTITISKSTGLELMKFEGKGNCIVSVTDLNNNVFYFNESYFPGNYQGFIAFQYLIAGNAFKVNVLTPEGGEYESDFEEMTVCPAVDSVYFELKDAGTQSIPGATQALQFYVDLRINEGLSKFYRYKLEETYEYHSTWPIDRYWAGGWRNAGQDYSLFTCYKTESVKQIFSLTTKYVANNYLKYPLNMVDNTTQKLYHKYSLLVKQYSISESAYDYWQLLTQNNQESGGLFDKQPANAIGNVKCLSNSSEKVLGYFGVSSVNEKRIFVQDVEGLNFTNDLFCIQYLVEMPVFIYDSKPAEWPIYVAPVPFGQPSGLYLADESCFDCTKNGGVTIKPDFWE